MKIKEVKYVSEYSVEVIFDDGVKGIVHLNDLVEKGIFKVLQDKERFAQVYTTGNAIAWSDQLEIDAIKIYLDITGKNFGEVMNPKFLHAADQ
jgi:hypothetical protein